MEKSEIEIAFETFQKHFPKTNDLTLIILKGHLLIEGQVWELIKNRLKNHEALATADLTSFQKICIAQALTDSFSENVHDAGWLWPALKKLNKLRNDIAHKLSKSGIEDRVKDFISRVPDYKSSDDLMLDFEWALLNTMFTVNFLIQKTTPEDFKNL